MASQYLFIFLKTLMKFTALLNVSQQYPRSFPLSYKLLMSLSNVIASEKAFLPPYPKLSLTYNL